MLANTIYPLTPFQEQIFSICYQFLDSCAYNIPAAIRIRGEVSKDILLSTLFHLQKWHPELRLTIQEIKGQYFQSVSSSLNVIEKKTNEFNLEECLAKEAKKPIGCINCPLARITVWEITKDYYVVQFTISHLIADRFSLSIVIKSIWKIYDRLLQGDQPGEHESLTFIEYLDAAQKNGSIHHSFYLKNLKGLNLNDYIPLDYSRISKFDFSGSTCSNDINSVDYNIIKNFCKAHKVSPYVFFTTMLMALLHKLTGYNDIAFATAVSTRSIKYINTFGPLVNTLIVRQIVSSHIKTYLDLLLAVQDTINQTLKSSEISFNEVLSRLRQEQLDSNYIYQCMFVYQGQDFDTIYNDKISMELQLIDNQSAKCDLTIYIFDCENKFKIKFEYAASNFKAKTIEVLLNDLILMSLKVAKCNTLDIKAPIHSYQDAIIRNYEKGQEVELGNEPILLQKLQENFQQFGSKISVCYKQDSYSYNDLAFLSDNVAHNLFKYGIRKGDIVGVYTERTHKLIPIIIGLWKIGGVYLPLESPLSKARLSNILNIALPKLILFNLKHEENFIFANTTQISFDDILFISYEQNILHLEYPDPLDNAYLIFTSGSTGKPKGVFINHIGIYNRIAWMQNYLNVSSLDNILQKTSLMFDVSMWELLLPFYCGCQLTVAENSKSTDPEYLAQLIQDKKVSIVHFVPVFLDTSISIFKQYFFGSIKHIVCSGDILKESTIKNVYSFLHHGAIIHNLYGPTEASIDVSYYRCPRNKIERLTPIGKPISNTELYLVKDNEIVNDVLIAGEIFISGVCLSPGYCNAPLITQEKFINYPFPDGYRRVYRTGDLGMWSSDGELLFLGRSDRQIKIRGIRIEAEEIESRLESYDKIKNAYVCKQVETNGFENLLAYLVLKEGFTCSDSEVKSYLLRYFIHSTIPNKVVFIDKFPLISSGKIDVQALLQTTTIMHSSIQEDKSNCKDDTVAILSKIWKKVLSISTVNIDDNYFNLGGDSIKSIQITSLAKDYGFTFSVSDFLNNPTIRDLAKFRTINKAVNKPYQPFELLSHKDKLSIEYSEIEDAYPLSHLQKSLVYHSEVSDYYNIYVTTFRIKGKFQLKLWQAAIKNTAIQHPIMRTYFEMGTCLTPLQVILPNVKQICSYLDYREATDKDGGIHEFIHLEKNKIFDWEKAPLFRFCIHHLEDDLIQFTVSEPCLDGWSVAIICTEIFNHYRAMLDNRTHLPTDRSKNMGDFIKHENIALASEEYRKFWQNELLRCNKTILLHNKKADASIFRVEYRLSDIKTKDLLKFATERTIPIKSLLLAIHCKLLGELTCQKIITTGLMANARPESDGSEKIAGMFINVLPLTVEIASKSIVKIARELIIIEAAINKYRALPYAAIISNMKDSLFDTIFNFTNFYPYKDFVDSQDIQILSIRGTDQTLFGVTLQFTLLPIENALRLAIDFNHIEREDPYVEHINSTITSLLDVELNNFSEIG